MPLAAARGGEAPSQRVMTRMLGRVSYTATLQAAQEWSNGEIAL